MKINRIGTAEDTLTGRGGLFFFVRYLTGIGIFSVLSEYFGDIRKSRKGLPADDCVDCVEGKLDLNEHLIRHPAGLGHRQRKWKTHFGMKSPAFTTNGIRFQRCGSLPVRTPQLTQTQQKPCCRQFLYLHHH